MPIPIADIVKISAPASAPAGAQVRVDVSIKNNSTNYMYLAITGVYDSAQLPCLQDYLYFNPLQTRVLSGLFTMPSKSVRVIVWSWYWDAGLNKWVFDQESYVDIALSVLKPAFAGFNISQYDRV